MPVAKEFGKIVGSSFVPQHCFRKKGPRKSVKDVLKLQQNPLFIPPGHGLPSPAVTDLAASPWWVNRLADGTTRPPSQENAKLVATFLSGQVFQSFIKALWI